MIFYKYHGAGNDFLIADDRDGSYRLTTKKIVALCDRHAGIGADGVMLLKKASAGDAAFEMAFYNPDGSHGMMCGNGGRCIVAFADMLGIKPAAGSEYRFLAPDGLHVATILSSVISSEVEKSLWTVRLKMIDVEGITPVKDGYFLNTGTRHFVKFVDDVNAVDVEEEGKRLRWDPVFQPEGTNVNFVQVAPDGLHVRTFEKGVEGETLACGTGLTASAIVYGSPTNLQCRRGDWLRVDFTKNGTGAKDVFLTGPAECVSII